MNDVRADETGRPVVVLVYGPPVLPTDAARSAHAALAPRLDGGPT